MKGRVYKRGKTWYYRFDIGPDPLTGRRRQANGSGYKTEREAWTACRDAMAEHEKGRGVRSARRKVADALEGWLSRIEHSIKPSMVQNWRNYAAYYVIPYIGQRDVTDIDGAVCDALYARLLAEGRVKAKPRTRPGTRAVHERRFAPNRPGDSFRNCRRSPASSPPYCPVSLANPLAYMVVELRVPVLRLREHKPLPVGSSRHRRPTFRGAGQAPHVRVERPTGRTTWT